MACFWSGTTSRMRRASRRTSSTVPSPALSTPCAGHRLRPPSGWPPNTQHATADRTGAEARRRVRPLSLRFGPGPPHLVPWSHLLPLASRTGPFSLSAPSPREFFGPGWQIKTTDPPDEDPSAVRQVRRPECGHPREVGLDLPGLVLTHFPPPVSQFLPPLFSVAAPPFVRPMTATKLPISLSRVPRCPTRRHPPR
jgi:hypothetical protein